MRRRRSRRLGKNEPWRSFGIASSTSPAAVDSRRGRCPLRCAVRVSVRSWRAAPMNAVVSASISCWSTHSNDARMVSVISPALIAASRSDRSESVRVTGGSPLCSCQEHVEDHAGDPPNWWTLYNRLPTPRHVTSPLYPLSYGSWIGTMLVKAPMISESRWPFEASAAGLLEERGYWRVGGVRSGGPILVSLVRPPLEDGTSSPTRLPFTAARLHRRGRAEGALAGAQACAQGVARRCHGLSPPAASTPCSSCAPATRPCGAIRGQCG